MDHLNIVNVPGLIVHNSSVIKKRADLTFKHYSISANQQLMNEYAK